MLDPFVDQILVLLGQLPSDLHPIVLAEAALATRLPDAPVQCAAVGPLQDSDPPTGSGLQ